MFYLSPLYLLVFIVSIVLSTAAQLYIRSAYGKWSKVRNSIGLTGLQVGQRIITQTDLGAKLALQGKPVQFFGIGGTLTDHYDPGKNTVGLSQGIATANSVAAMAVVAHELGHAEQDANNSILMSARNFLVPAVTISPMISYILIFVGLIFNFPALFNLGILFFGVMVVFALLTLPVEIDASRRALKLLRQTGIMQTEDDERGARKVLTAAASTYVAAAVTAILQLLYYISIGRRRG